MPYKMQLVLEGQEISLENNGVFSYAQLLEKLETLHQSYPTFKGVGLSVSRVGSQHPALECQTVLTVFGRFGQDHLLECFFYQDEFESFLSKKKVIPRAEVDNKAWFSLDCYTNADKVIQYPKGYYLLEAPGQVNTYINPVAEGYKHTSLPFLERELYLDYLADIQF